jgi:hypothetical protein
MSFRQHLFAIYADWKQWSLEEGNAIRQSDWPRMHSCQSAKRALQPKIVETTTAAKSETLESGESWEVLELALRREVAGLIELENKNGEILHSVKKLARAEQAELDRSQRSLRQIRSYAPVSATAWSTYT